MLRGGGTPNHAACCPVSRGSPPASWGTPQVVCSCAEVSTDPSRRRRGSLDLPQWDSASIGGGRFEVAGTAREARDLLQHQLTSSPGRRRCRHAVNVRLSGPVIALS